MQVIVISGPIASGKSTLARTVAERLRQNNTHGAVVDLDLVYEMLDPRRRAKTDAATWSAARRTAGRIAAGFLADGRSVVVEGSFAGDRALHELLGELPDATPVSLVLLETDIATALQRVSADPTRGLSKDKTFLTKHYREFKHGWDDRPILRLDTNELGVDESAARVLAWPAT